MGFYVLATITLYSTGLNNMNIRIVSLCFALGLAGCNSNPVVSDIASATLAATGNPEAALLLNTLKTQQYKCADLTQEQAQTLLEQGHTYLDPENDGKACLPNIASTGTAAKSTATPVAIVATPTSVTMPYIPTSSSLYKTANTLQSGTAQKPTSDSLSHQYRCPDLTDSQAQVLMEAGHTYLDADGDGDACEPDPRRDYAPVAAKSSDGNCHWVEGYTRKNGTKVRGHKRCK